MLDEYTPIIYGFILSAIITLTILAWRDIIEHYVDKYVPKPSDQVKWKWAYATLLTMSFIVMTRYFNISAI
jgi:hypothetical protein